MSGFATAACCSCAPTGSRLGLLCLAVDRLHMLALQREHMGQRRQASRLQCGVELLRCVVDRLLALTVGALLQWADAAEQRDHRLTVQIAATEEKALQPTEAGAVYTVARRRVDGRLLDILRENVPGTGRPASLLRLVLFGEAASRLVIVRTGTEKGTKLARSHACSLFCHVYLPIDVTVAR